MKTFSAFDMPRDADGNLTDWSGEPIASMPSLVLINERPSTVLRGTGSLNWSHVPDPTPALIALADDPVRWSSSLPDWTPGAPQSTESTPTPRIGQIALYAGLVTLGALYGALAWMLLP